MVSEYLQVDMGYERVEEDGGGGLCPASQTGVQGDSEWPARSLCPPPGQSLVQDSPWYRGCTCSDMEYRKTVRAALLKFVTLNDFFKSQF